MSSAEQEKLDALGRLAGQVAHDFNNKLTAISGYADLLSLSFDADDVRAADVEQIRAAAADAARLTRRLQAFARRQTLLAERLDANAVVAQAASSLAAGDGIEVTVTLADGLPHVHTDAAQLAQAVADLALNAVEAMPEGGRLDLSTAAIARDGRDAVAIEVADTGTGMDDDVRARLFEPFFTTKPKGVGTGLGLATAYGVVTQSGGTIEVESAPGAGSTLRILLPAA